MTKHNTSQKIFQDGYIIFNKNYSNTSSLVKIISAEGVTTAICKGARSKKNINLCNIANKVSFCHYAREGTLGVFAIEPILNPIIANFNNHLAVLAAFSLCDIICELIEDGFEEYAKIFAFFEIFVEQLTQQNQAGWMLTMHKIEQIIIKNCGYFENKHLESGQAAQTCLKKSYANLVDCLKNLGINHAKFVARAEFNRAIFSL